LIASLHLGVFAFNSTFRGARIAVGANKSHPLNPWFQFPCFFSARSAPLCETFLSQHAVAVSIPSSPGGERGALAPTPATLHLEMPAKDI
jgi:hypothetical protein